MAFFHPPDDFGFTSLVTLQIADPAGHSIATIQTRKGKGLNAFSAFPARAASAAMTEAVIGVPEPGTVLLVGAGLLGLALARRRVG